MGRGSMKDSKKAEYIRGSFQISARHYYGVIVLCIGVLMFGCMSCANGGQASVVQENEENGQEHVGMQNAAVGEEGQRVWETADIEDGQQIQTEADIQVEEQTQKEGEKWEEESGRTKEKTQEEQQKQAELEALQAVFKDMEAVEVYTTTDVNVRMAPSTEAGIWKLVKRGTVFQKNGEAEGWSRVVTEDGTYYIKSDYLREKGKPGEGGHMVAIDAGHQVKANTEKEPIGPGASESKMKVTGGTRGTTTGLYEYELTLLVSEKLRAELENRGYQVYMVRENHEVNISNSKRAQMAYESGAKIFVRIHANGSENSSANGAMTICPTPQNPYVADLYADSQRLSALVLDGLTASTGCRRERIWETDTMSGINWSTLPVTIVEMGYMTNPEEDKKMAQDDYQQLIAIGIADGIDAYFLN